MHHPDLEQVLYRYANPRLRGVKVKIYQSIKFTGAQNLLVDVCGLAYPYKTVSYLFKIFTF